MPATAFQRVGGGSTAGRHARWSLALSLSLLFGCGGQGDPILIGLALPLGDPAVFPMVRAAKLAVEEINASGGIGGRLIELVERDDFGDPDSAVSVANDLYDGSVVAVIGSAYSGATLAAAPIYNGGGNPVVQISPSASSPAVTGAGDYTFRVCSSDLEYGAALARWARQKLQLGRAAVLYVNDEYGRGVRHTFASEFTRLGGEIVELDPFLAVQPEVAPYVERIGRTRGADVLVLAANQAEGIDVLRKIREAKLGLPILGGDGFVGIESREPAAEGMYVSSGYLAGTNTPANRKFVEAYRRMYPAAGPPDQGAAATYDVVYLLRDVVARAGTDRRRIRETIAGIGSESPAFEGVLGPIAFDKNGDVPTLGVKIGVVRNGALAPAP